MSDLLGSLDAVFSRKHPPRAPSPADRASVSLPGLFGESVEGNVGRESAVKRSAFVPLNSCGAEPEREETGQGQGAVLRPRPRFRPARLRSGSSTS